MEWNKIRNRRASQRAGNTLAVEGDEELPLPDPEEIQRRREAQERAFERMLGNARELRRRLLALLDLLPDDEASEEDVPRNGPNDTQPSPDDH